MAQAGTSNAIVNVMLSWLKGLAGWVLRLFDLASGYSPLQFLAENWLKILVILLVIGLAGDLLIWLIRWRPHWVWFHKKRVIINDKNFFDEEYAPDRDEDEWAAGNWRDDDFVVTGTARRKRELEHEQARLRREREAEASGDVFTSERFNIDAQQRSSDRYEDDVFRVSDLPTRSDKSERPRKPHRGNSSRR